MTVLHRFYCIVYVQRPPSNALADVIQARGLNFHQSLHLHPYSVYASSKSSGESVQNTEPSLIDNVISTV